jgi:hypothetical protein
MVTGVSKRGWLGSCRGIPNSSKKSDQWPAMERERCLLPLLMLMAFMIMVAAGLVYEATEAITPRGHFR